MKKISLFEQECEVRSGMFSKIGRDNWIIVLKGTFIIQVDILKPFFESMQVIELR